MGLRLVAHFFDRIEALIAQSAIDAAGIPVFLHSSALLTMDAGYTMAVGGFRLVVCAEDVDAAVSVLEEAQSNPLREGERLEVELDFLNAILSFAIGGMTGAPTPIRGRRWCEVAA
jgi:hypothetical protein